MGDLEESGRRLEEAGILIGVRDDGTVIVVQTEAQCHQAVLDGFTLYSARDMYVYVTLGQKERRLLHEFKQRFGGTTEWKNTA